MSHRISHPLASFIRPGSVASALIAIGLLSSCGKKQSAADGPPGVGDHVQSVEVMEITTRDLQETVDLVGTIAANESAELRSEIPGTVIAIEFEEGAQVKKDDVLIRIDTRELSAQIAETRAQLELAQSKLERNQTLLTERAVSQQEFDAAQAEYTQLKASLDILLVREQKSVITAPFDGVAGARSNSVGDYISSANVITTVDDLSRIKVEMEVPERYLPFLEKGTTFSLSTATAEPGGEPVLGEVYFVSSTIDPNTRSTLVKGYVESPSAALRPGMFAHISLILRTVKDAMIVPEASILSSARGTVVIRPIEKDGKTVAEFVPVKTGLRTPGYVQITPVGPPLKPGDLIVSSGVGALILFPGVELRTVDPVVTPEQPEQTDRVLNAVEDN